MPPPSLRAVCLALGLVLALLAPAGAQGESPISVRARGVAGSEIQAKVRRFFSVNVVLENASTHEIEGVLRVYRADRPGRATPEQSLFYERSLSIPGKGRRIENIYYYCQEGEPDNQVAVSFRPSEGPAPETAYPPFRLIRGGSQHLLFLSSRPEAADAAMQSFRAVLPGPARPTGTVLARAELSALPDRFAGYEAFDAVVVADLDPGDLPAERAAALLEWVEAGGDLIVAASGGRSQLPPAIQEALPVVRPPGARQGTRTRTLQALRALAAGRGAPSPQPVRVEQVEALPGATILAGDAQGPLVVRGRHGAGWVTFLAFPLDAGPLRGWPGMTQFGGSLLRPAREDPEAKGEGVPPAPPLEELLLNLSEALESLEPPSALLVAPLLIFYVLLVSPLNYLVLSRVKRLGLSQLSAAGVVIGFGILFYGIGFLYKGSQSLSTQVALVELPEGADDAGRARVDVMTGYFATDRGLTEASAPPRAMVGPLAEQAVSREGHVHQDGDGSSLSGVTLDTWALRRFRSLRSEALGGLDAELLLEDGLLKGTLRNRTAMRLRNPFILMDHAILVLEELAPQGESPDALQLANALEALTSKRLKRPRLDFLSGLVHDANRRYPARYGEIIGIGTGDSPYAGRPEPRILDSFRRRLARVPQLPGKLPALFLATVEGDPGGVVLESPARPVLERTVVLCELQVDLAAGFHNLNGLSPRVSAHNFQGRDPSWIPTSGQTGSPPMLGQALDPSNVPWVEWIWRLPASPAAPLEIQNLRLRWRFDSLAAAAAAATLGQEVTTFAAYNHRIGDWVKLQDPSLAKTDSQGNGSWPDNTTPPLVTTRPADLVDVLSGTVRVRLRSALPTDNLVVERLELDVSFERE